MEGAIYALADYEGSGALVEASRALLFRVSQTNNNNHSDKTRAPASDWHRLIAHADGGAAAGSSDDDAAAAADWLAIGELAELIMAAVR